MSSTYYMAKMREKVLQDCHTAAWHTADGAKTLRKRTLFWRTVTDSKRKVGGSKWILKPCFRIRSTKTLTKISKLKTYIGIFPGENEEKCTRITWTHDLLYKHNT